MSPLSAIYLISLGAIIGAFMWFSLDMRSILKSAQRRHKLSIEGRWEDLEKHFRRTLGTYRPFVWFHRRFLLPGGETIQYALFLYKQGRLEEALANVDQAIRRIENKPRIFESIHRSVTLTVFSGALRTRVLILTGMGKYNEARAAAAQLQQLTGGREQSNSALVLLEYHCGRLDEALAQAEAVPRTDMQYDSARGVAALVYSMKGEFDRAIQTLSYTPSDASSFYTPEGLKLVSGTPEGAKLIELQRKKLAGVFPPARLLLMSQVYVAQEKFQDADRALDQAEKLIGLEPGIQLSYCRYRASSAAGQGKVTEAEEYIGRLRTIAQQRPKRSILWETHYTAGRCYLYLNRFPEALSELAEAERSALHPLEKHVTTYWTGRVHEAMGALQKAVPYYQAVAADSIPSRFRKQASEALSRLSN